MPYTICDSKYVFGTVYPPQMRVFRNPRGLKWYYAFVMRQYQIGGSIFEDLNLYKSETGETWTLVSNIETVPMMCSCALYDDGTQLIVYLVYGRYLADDVDRTIYYRRIRIPDTTSTPSIGASDVVDTGMGNCRPIIKLDRNGYIHVGFIRRRDIKIKGITWRLNEPYIKGTTVPYPPDNPVWTGLIQIDVHPDIEFGSWFSKISLVMFGGTGDIGGCVYSIRDSAGVPYIRGCDIVSWDGSSYSLGTISDVSSIPDWGYMDWSFRAVSDEDDHAHVIYPHNVTNERIRHRKASAVNTVESWEAYTVVDDSNNSPEVDSVTLSLDKSVTPNDLYAIYVFGTYENYRLRWRRTPVDTISWGSESSISDDTVKIRRTSASFREYVNAFHVIYQRYVDGNLIRYCEIPLVVPKEVKESTTIPIRYVKGSAIIMRNGKIIAHVTPYTPYRTERPIQPQVG